MSTRRRPDGSGHEEIVSSTLHRGHRDTVDRAAELAGMTRSRFARLAVAKAVARIVRTVPEAPRCSKCGQTLPRPEPFDQVVLSTSMSREEAVEMERAAALIGETRGGLLRLEVVKAAERLVARDEAARGVKRCKACGQLDAGDGEGKAA